MAERISNFQTEEAFKNIGDEDINNDFAIVFPSNYLNKFIGHTTVISEKKRKISIYDSKY